MAHYAAGDAHAFDELFRRYEGRAYRYFLARSRSRERAEDLYQELFLRIHRARDAYDPGRPFGPWFFQIARRLLVDDFRRADRSQVSSLDAARMRADEPGPDDVLVERESIEALLGDLSAEDRELLVRAKVQGMEYGEIAVALGRSIDAVKKAASRAMQRIRTAARREPSRPPAKATGA